MDTLIKEETLKNIADAIREIKQVDRIYTLEQMICALDAITLEDLIEGNFGEDVYIPDGIEHFNIVAFSGVSGIKTFTLPNTVKSIGYHAFNYEMYDCKKFVLPASVRSIADNAFTHCDYDDFYFLGGPINAGFESFWDHPKKMHIASLEDWVLCNFNPGIHYGGYNPFGDEGVYLNEELIEHLVIPEGVTQINNYIFEVWPIKTVVFPSTIDSVGYGLFMDCPNLTHITFKGTPSYMSSNALNVNQNSNHIILAVPWEEDEVDGAPWGLRDYTILYNCK